MVPPIRLALAFGSGERSGSRLAGSTKVSSSTAGVLGLAVEVVTAGDSMEEVEVTDWEGTVCPWEGHPAKEPIRIVPAKTCVKRRSIVSPRTDISKLVLDA